MRIIAFSLAIAFTGCDAISLKRSSREEQPDQANLAQTSVGAESQFLAGLLGGDKKAPAGGPAPPAPPAGGPTPPADAPAGAPKKEEEKKAGPGAPKTDAPATPPPSPEAA